MGDQIFIKVAPYWHVTGFGRKGKLAPRFIGSFEIVEMIGKVAYRLVLLASMDHIYNVFYVFLFVKYVEDPSHMLRAKELKALCMRSDQWEY